MSFIVPAGSGLNLCIGHIRELHGTQRVLPVWRGNLLLAARPGPMRRRCPRTSCTIHKCNFPRFTTKPRVRNWRLVAQAAIQQPTPALRSVEADSAFHGTSSPSLQLWLRLRLRGANRAALVNELVAAAATTSLQR